MLVLDMLDALLILVFLENSRKRFFLAICTSENFLVFTY